MKLATFLVAGRSEPVGGAVEGDRVVAFAGGASVIDVHGAGELPALGEESWPLPVDPCQGS